jgi:hypothetical protein
MFPGEEKPGYLVTFSRNLDLLEEFGSTWPTKLQLKNLREKNVQEGGCRIKMLTRITYYTDQ